MCRRGCWGVVCWGCLDITLSHTLLKNRENFQRDNWGKKYTLMWNIGKAKSLESIEWKDRKKNMPKKKKLATRELYNVYIPKPKIQLSLQKHTSDIIKRASTKKTHKFSSLQWFPTGGLLQKWEIPPESLTLSVIKIRTISLGLPHSVFKRGSKVSLTGSDIRPLHTNSYCQHLPGASQEKTKSNREKDSHSGSNFNLKNSHSTNSIS